MEVISKRNVNKIVKAAIAALPAIPYIMRSRRRTSVMAYVIGGVGFAIAGGLVAVMFFSPRTRTRALSAAKDTYGKVNQKIGKVNEKISHLRESRTDASSEPNAPMSNGLVGDNYGTGL